MSLDISNIITVSKHRLKKKKKSKEIVLFFSYGTMLFGNTFYIIRKLAY